MPAQNPIRIQYVIATLDRAGAEGQLTRLLTRLDKERFEIQLLCLTRGGPHEEALQKADIHYEILGKKSKYDPTLVWRLSNRISNFQPDILHTWMFTSNAFGRIAGILQKVPIRIISERAVDLWKTWPYRWTDRFLAPWTTCAVANAESVKCFVEVESGIPTSRVKVIPNGVDLNRFSLKEHHESAIIQFCAIGRLVPQKRMDVVIQAMNILRENGIKARLKIFGSGPLAKDLDRRIQRLNLRNEIEICEPVRDISDVFLSSDVFVLSSDWEGMPNVVLEAMASGLPVVATAVDGSKELVVEDETGFLVPQGNVTALVGAMKKLAESVTLRQTLGQNARKRVESEFSINQMVSRYEALYDMLISK